MPRRFVLAFQPDTRPLIANASIKIPFTGSRPQFYSWIAFILMTASFASNIAASEVDHVIEDPGEKAAIAAAAGRAVRNGPSLVLLTKTGAVKFEDGKDPNFSDPNFGYSISRYFPGQGFLLTAGYANSDVGGSIWVDETSGRVMDIDGNPIFSPDGRYFAVVSTCDGMGKCVIQIWRADGLKLLFERRPANDEYEDYENESWDGNSRITFDIGVHSPGPNGELTYFRSAIVETTPGVWQFDWTSK